MVETRTFALVSIPAMIVLGLRHALDVDPMAATDNLVRQHNAEKRSRWAGAEFSSGHMISVLVHMVFIIYAVAEVTGTDGLQTRGKLSALLLLG